MHAQSSKPVSGNESVSRISLIHFEKSLVHSKNSNDLDLPIAIRKGTRTYTQHLMSYFVPFNKFSTAY